SRRGDFEVQPRVTKFLFQLLETDFHRVREPSLLNPHRLRNSIRRLIQLRISIPHQIAPGKYHLVQERLRLPQQTSMRDGPPDNLPQHITATVVCWKYSI